MQIVSFEDHLAKKYLVSVFNGFINDPADSDFQRGFLSACLMLYREGLGQGVGDDRLILLDGQCSS